MKRFPALIFCILLATRVFSVEPDRYFFTYGSLNSMTWIKSTLVSGYRDDSLVDSNHLVDISDIIFFDKAKGSGYDNTGKLGCLYISPDVPCKEISVINATTIQLGLYGDNTSLPSAWTVNIGEESSLHFNNAWAKDMPVVVPDAAFMGKGVITFGSNITPSSDIRFGKIKGDALIRIPAGLVVKQIDSNSFIENPLAGYGTVIVKNPYHSFKLAEGSNVEFVLDSSIIGGWNVETNANLVSFKENFTRAWPLDAGTKAITTSFTTLFNNMYLAEIKNNDLRVLRASIEENSGAGLRVMQASAVWGDITKSRCIVSFPVSGGIVNLELKQDGPNIVGRMEDQSNHKIVGIAVAIAHELTGSQTWTSLPEGVVPEDILILDDSAELTLGFPALNHIEGGGKVFSAVAPTDSLLASLKEQNWKGTYKEVILPSDWLLKYYPVRDKTGADIGANGIALWKSYCLGLDPTDSFSLPILMAIQDGSCNTLTLVDRNVKTTQWNDIKVTRKLMEGVPGGVLTEVEDPVLSIDSGFKVELSPSSPKVRLFKFKYEFD